MDIKDVFQLSKGSLDQIEEMLNSNVEVSTEKTVKSFEMDNCTTCWGGSCANGITG